MRKSTTTIGITLISAIALAVSAQAQDQPATPQQASEGSQCAERLSALAQRMREEGYWLAGYSAEAMRGYGVGTTVDPASPQGGAPGAAAPVEAPETAGAPGGEVARPGMAGSRRTNPWGGVTWQARPQVEIRTLFQAARVLARNDNEQACMTVAEAAEQRYDHYAGQLREVGVEPQEITTWREAEIAAAVPVSESRFPRGIDEMIGANVRNQRDEPLGEIEEVVVDPQSGSVAYVVVSTGGFLGLGEERVPVPWAQLRVAPSMSTFVLPVAESAMENAPRAESSTLIGEERTAEQEVQSYWEQAVEQATNRTSDQ